MIDNTRALDDTLSKQWRVLHPLQNGEKEVMAYDLTNVLFFGVTCPLAEMGHNSKHQLRKQVNVAVVVSRRDHSPLFHFVYHGSRNGSGTVRNLLVQLQQAGANPGLLIADRGIINNKTITESVAMGWHVLGGISKTSKEVQGILDRINVNENPETFVQQAREGAIYASGSKEKIFGMERYVVVYVNGEKQRRERDERNNELSKMGKALNELSEKGDEWPEAKLHDKIKGTIYGWEMLVKVVVKRGGVKPRIAWKFDEKELKAAASRDGKYLLLCTDEKITPKEAVETYIGKDFVEKSFRTLKTCIEVEPVRHRLECRVKAYISVCMLALRLKMALWWMLKEAGIENDTAAFQERLLEELSRVERVDVRLGNEVKAWYLNRTDFITKGLNKIGMKDLLTEELKIADKV